MKAVRWLIAPLLFLSLPVLVSPGVRGEEEFPVHPAAGRRGVVERQRVRFEVETLLNRAEKAIAEDDYPAAIPDLEEAVRVDPYDSRPAVILIRLYEREGRLAEALDQTARLIELFPDYPRPRLLRAILFEKSGEKALALAEWRAVLPLLGEDREKLEPAYRHLVQLLTETGDCAAAEELLLRAPELISSGSAWLSVGQCRAGRGEWEEAREAFERGLESGPDEEEALLLRSSLLYAYKHLDRDREYYQSAAELAGETDDPRFMLEAAAAADRLGDYPSAAGWIERAGAAGIAGEERDELLAGLEYRMEEYGAVIERLAPRDDLSAGSLWLLGNAFYRTGQPGLALHFLERIDSGDLPDPGGRRELYATLAYLYFDQGLYPQAIAEIDRIPEGEDSRELRLVRARALARLGRHSEALKELEAIPLPAGDTPEERFFRGDLAEAMGLSRFALEEYPESEEAFSRSLKEIPDYPAALFGRGVTYLKLEEEEAARDDFERLLETSPAPPAALWGNLGTVYGKLGEYDRGLEALERSLEYYRYDVDTLMEYGYQGMKGNENPAAREGFRAAIDLQAAVIPLLPDGPAEEYRRDQLLMKEEYTKVDKTWSLQLYASRTELDDTVTEPFADTIDGALASQAGALIGYRPPVIGFRDEKTVDFFLRGLANFKRRSYRLEPDSYQGGAGVLIKPFKQFNYNLSFERLFKIGDNSENNWLWRNMLSLEFGERPEKETPVWLGGRLYGEVSYYLESPRRWIYYLDGRLGPSFSLTRLLTLTVPQAMGVARFQSDDPDGRGTYYLAGLGANLRLLAGEGRYTTGGWYIDGFAHYTYGRFSLHPDGLEERDFSGWIFGISFVK
ncbi:MAG: tetratricopeptide repeat protein [Candidatus Erginobacter occultus]|nr:tetratricopeptide repeat protein [Candidatus Erginobacter occultus]